MEEPRANKLTRISWPLLGLICCCPTGSASIEPLLLAAGYSDVIIDTQSEPDSSISCSVCKSTPLYTAGNGLKQLACEATHQENSRCRRHHRMWAVEGPRFQGYMLLVPDARSQCPQPICSFVCPPPCGPTAGTQSYFYTGILFWSIHAYLRFLKVNSSIN